MSKDKLIVPKLWLVGFDETECWTPEVQAAAGKVIQYGVWDEHETTFPCSLTAVGFVHMGGLFFTQKRVSDDMDDIIRRNLESGGDYYDYRWLDGRKDKVYLKYLTPTRKEWVALLKEHGSREAAYAEMIEKVLEHLQGNTMECEVASKMGIEFDYSDEVSDESA